MCLTYSEYQVGRWLCRQLQIWQSDWCCYWVPCPCHRCQSPVEDDQNQGWYKGRCCSAAPHRSYVHWRPLEDHELVGLGISSWISLDVEWAPTNVKAYRNVRLLKHRVYTVDTVSVLSSSWNSNELMRIYIRNFETCGLQRHDFTLDCCGESPLYLPYIRVRLENRKGWQNKQGWNGPFESELWQYTTISFCVVTDNVNR